MGLAAIKGIVQRYVTAPRDEGFAVLSIALPNGSSARICGRGLAGLSSGQDVEVVGSWTTHQKWGRQFAATRIRVVAPETAAGMARWLAETAIPGLPARTAAMLAEAFGTDVAAHVITEDPLARKILGEWFGTASRNLAAHKAEEALGPRLAEMGIGPDVRERIFLEYGIKAGDRITQDPYRMVHEIEGSPFAAADRLAKATGPQLLSRSRLVAATRDALNTAAGDGHTAVSTADLSAMVAKRTGVGRDVADALLEDLDHPDMVATTIRARDGDLVDAWALLELDRAEDQIARAVLDKCDEPSLVLEADARAYVAKAETMLGVELNKEQREGARMALANSFSILTGGPGTGKTTTLRVITTAWSLAAADGWVRGDIRQGSPTGKASQRMKESTGIDATTLHRMLGVGPDGRTFQRNEADPIEAGFIAIDESSMKDVPLAAGFTRAWGDATVLLLGDPDQLASVGAGRVLGDLIDSGVVPLTHLVQVRRQAEGSAIAEGAKAIREGRMPTMEPGSDFMFIDEPDADRVADIVSQLHAAFVSDGMNVQALTPGHKGAAGTHALNTRLQADAALEGDAVRISGRSVARAGDKIIQIVNDNEAEIFNGDAGRVARVEDGRAVLSMGDREVAVGDDSLARLALAYALTVHKSQGSEYEVVLMPITGDHRGLLKRTLIYTGLTRAKQICIVVGSRKAMEKAIAVDDGAARTTTLELRLRTMSGQ